MKILNCNIQGLGLPEKRRILHDFIIKEHVDILCLQETKKDSYSSQFFKSIASCYDTKQFLPSVGSAGGILMGFNSSLFTSIFWHIGKYSITTYLENHFDKVKWACATVYRPVDPVLKLNFWDELTDIGLSWAGTWVIGDDFNAIRNRSEKIGFLLMTIIQIILILGYMLLLFRTLMS
jgi:Endonuclease/Exonuclease/phosphatase family